MTSPPGTATQDAAGPAAGSAADSDGEREPKASGRPSGRPSGRRSGGPFARLKSTFHVYGVFWYKLHLFAVRRVPPFLYRVLVPPFAFFFYCTLHKIRGAIARNQEAVLGRCGWLERQ